MIEVYRDRLKLDVMVVNAFNQILTIQPTNFEAADALAAQYETMKRWPDLIALLRKKAAVGRVAGARRSRCTLRVANLFLEKFSNQAEAIKVVRVDPRARSGEHRRARPSSSRCTRSAATGRS